MREHESDDDNNALVKQDMLKDELVSNKYENMALLEDQGETPPLNKIQEDK